MSESREYVTTAEELGRIHICEDVIAAVAAVSAAEVEGVAGLSANLGSDIAELLGRKNLARGVKLELKENEVTVDVAVLICYGYRITDVAKLVQEAVQSGIEDMAGLTVRAVNIHVGGIAMEKPPRKGK